MLIINDFDFPRRNEEMSIDDFEGQTATIGITASSHWANFERKSGRFTNDAHQQTYFSGDDCFKFSIDYEKEIVWGQED